MVLKMCKCCFKCGLYVGYTDSGIFEKKRYCLKCLMKAQNLRMIDDALYEVMRALR